jgi:predicted nucleic acid-binding protein
VIDTDILIDHLRGIAAATTFLNASRATGTNTLSIISAMELVQGCRNGQELQTVRRLLAAMIVVPMTDQASETALQLMETLFLRHGLRLPDALIAAAALDLGETLHTRNARHFGVVPGLTIERPY